MKSLMKDYMHEYIENNDIAFCLNTNLLFTFIAVENTSMYWTTFIPIICSPIDEVFTFDFFFDTFHIYFLFLQSNHVAKNNAHLLCSNYSIQKQVFSYEFIYRNNVNKSRAWIRAVFLFSKIWPKLREKTLRAAALIKRFYGKPFEIFLPKEI